MMADATTCDPTATDRARSHSELTEELETILAGPRDLGTLDLIVARPSSGQRKQPKSVRLTFAKGVEGDHWSKGCWRETEGGDPHPDVQICIMMSRCIAAIAGPKENWAAAGDNLFIDMNLTPDNAPAGTRLAIGSVVLEITEEPHNGCAAFIERYGRDACVFVNTGPGKQHRLRGIYARVIKDGVVSLGDQVKKIT